MPVARLAPLALLACARGPVPAAAPQPAAPEPAAAAALVPVALTFDDLPYQTRRGGVPLESDPAAWGDASDRLLAALSAAGATATVFVNCGNLAEDDALVARWRDAGHSVGNHTAHHRSAAEGELDAWVADLRACDGLWPEGSDEARWFRFPYLWRGDTVERRDAVAAAITDAGYTTVPVTVDTHDWAFEFYRKRHPEARPELAALLGEIDADAVAEARAVSRDKLGREAAQVVLLHVNAVTAEALPAILAGLARDGMAVVPVAEAMADPLYAEPDAWAGPGGRWWLARTAPTERPDGAPWYRDREAEVVGALEQRYGPLR